MTRAEHLQWAKDRALVYADQGDAQLVATSMISDLSKHPETRNHDGMLVLKLLSGGHMKSSGDIRKFIEGFS